MSQQVVLASNNRGKLKELENLLAPLGLTIIPQGEFAIADAEETGLTFVENAIIKARHASQLSGLPAIADDSGLEVDYLQGAPGIYSARFSVDTDKNIVATDASNNEKLLSLLNGVAVPERSARFQCCVVFMRHAADPTPLICQGTWEGQIAFEPAGENGFGYDPLFYIPELSCTSAQLDKSKKNTLSHRAKATAELLQQLQHRPI